jgi:hypothetical protein
MIGLRVNRYSWWTHWRELADYILPRRYKWLITPNQMARGSPINQHILDSTGTLAARNLTAGMLTGVCNPTGRWFRLKIGRIDSTQTSPVSLWLAEVERLMMLVFQESNWYTAMAVMFFDLAVFGTAVVIIYEDFDNVIKCFNPCLGEFYLENDADFTANLLDREFTMTVSQTVEEFGVENVSPAVAGLWDSKDGANKTRELVVAHSVGPSADPHRYGIPAHFPWREIYWEWGGSASPQGGSSYAPGLLRKRGFHECPFMAFRWDLVSNDAYGRSPGMDALPDIKQLQLETKRKAQAIDKLVNPPMVADIQLKNQPASLLPGGVTYVSGVMSKGRPGFAPVYQVAPPVKEIMEDLNEVKTRIKDIFFNPLFQTASQYETRSNVTAMEWDMRKAESLVMLGPVIERTMSELRRGITRVFGIMSRAGILPPAPAEVQGEAMTVHFESILQTSQNAAQSAGIERVFQLVGNLAGIDPAAVDNIDIDFGLEKMSSLLGNDPKLVRSPDQLAQIRQQRAQQQAQAQQAEQAEKMAAGAKTLSETQVGGGQSALQKMTGLG